MKAPITNIKLNLINFSEVIRRLPDITFNNVSDETIEKIYDCDVYKVHVVSCDADLTKTQYNKIKSMDTTNWTDTQFRRHLKIQKESSEYQMIPDFGYPRELCISVFRTKISTDPVWMKRALQILSNQFTDKEIAKYRSIDLNNCGANRVDSPRIIYCYKNFDKLTPEDHKYLMKVLPKYAAQIIKFSNKDKLKKYFDKYFSSPVPF